LNLASTEASEVIENSARVLREISMSEVPLIAGMAFWVIAVV